MGDVYAAVDEVLGRSVAVKTLRGTASGLGAAMLDERFRLEARAIAALSHPHIVQVYDIDLAADPPYLVMERVAGPSLKERLATGAMSANELRALGIQIARALAAAHEAGIVHRDVKPANVLAAGPDTWKLADFGVAHVPDSTLTMTGQFIGSPAYAPPEALVRGETTAAGDVFGLGASLYCAAAGRWPRTDATVGGLLAPVPSVRTLVPDLPPEIVAVIDRAVELEPDRRPRANELAEALAGGVLPVVARASSPAVNTQFVPDEAPAGGVVPPASEGETVFVADATHAPPTPSQRPSWKPWAIVGGLVLMLLIVIALASRDKAAATDAVRAGANRDDAAAAVDHSSTEPAPPEEPEAPAPPPEPTESALEPPPPGQIRALTPRITDRRAAKDWEKVVDALYDHDFHKAREKLERWERRWGETIETRDLRQQLEALPDRELDD